jgi:arylamine N-acetyltransferase
MDYSNYLYHLMPIQVYIERLEMGYGGVCWTLARGFHWLVTNLGFDAHYYYMDPGHVCVVVKLPEGEFYCDVGYAVPFFQAKPLKQNFLARSSHELFKYEVKKDTVLVTRTPGPTKTLILKPKTHTEINSYFEEANVIQSKFLNTLTISKYFDKKLLRLTGNTLIGDGPERTLNDEEIINVLVKRFGIYPSIYNEAKAKLGDKA